MKSEELILICAVRYALGRMTYVVNDVCKYVTGMKDKLSKQCITVIVRDIEEALDFHHRINTTLGMECDEQAWVRLLEVLKSCTTYK